MAGYVGPRTSILIYTPSEILFSPLRVDLNVLCDLTERLSGLSIMAHQANLRGGVLHNVTLPRSWFIKIIFGGMSLKKDTSIFFALVSTIIELMQRIDAQVQQYPTSTSDIKEQFTTDGGRMTNLTGSLYITRL